MDSSDRLPVTAMFYSAKCLFVFGLAFAGLTLSPPFALAGHDDEYVERIPADRVKALMDGGEKIFFIDLRAANEFQKTRLPGARSIPVTELQKRYGEIPKSGRVILYCPCPNGDNDEAYAYLTLRGKGYRNVSVLEDGFSGWEKRRYPTENR